MSSPSGQVDFAAIITHAPAHNSRVYTFMAERASLHQLAEFLTWDAAQPPFVEYLRPGLAKLPTTLRPALAAHIEDEVSQDHAGLFRVMHTELMAEVGEPSFVVDEARVRRLNGPVSPAYVHERPLGHFLGGFMATELMSQRRCAQLLAGLVRLGSRADRRYLELHAEADAHHWIEVQRDLVWPAIAGGHTDVAEVLAGVHERQERSSEYLEWYAGTKLGLEDRGKT